MQGQLLAARSASASLHLLHGRTADDRLAVVGALGPSNGSAHQQQQHKSHPRIPGLKLPSSWHDLETVLGGSYIFGSDGCMQQFEFALDDDDERTSKNEDTLLLQMMASTALSSNGSAEMQGSADGSIGVSTFPHALSLLEKALLIQLGYTLLGKTTIQSVSLKAHVQVHLRHLKWKILFMLAAYYDLA